MSEMGERITDLLRQQGLTQHELAEKIGVTEVTLSRYISGKRTPRSPTVTGLTKALHTTSDYLLGHEAENDDPETEYYRTQRAVARNARIWTPKQKADLVNALFECD